MFKCSPFLKKNPIFTKLLKTKEQLLRHCKVRASFEENILVGTECQLERNVGFKFLSLAV